LSMKGFYGYFSMLLKRMYRKGTTFTFTLPVVEKKQVGKGGK